MTTTQRDKRAMVVGGVVLAVALLGFLAFRVLGGSDDEPTMEAPSGAVAPGTSTQPGLLPEAGQQGRQEQENGPPLVFRGVDPFQPLVKARRQPSRTSEPRERAQEPAGPTSAVVGGQVVTLVGIFDEGGTEKARIDVGGTVYSPKKGANFTGDFVLLGIDDPCVQVAWRDQSFRLCLQ